MRDWRDWLRFDPLPPILLSKNEALHYFASRDLLELGPVSAESLWQTREVERIVHRQLREGSWKYPGGGKQYLRSKEDYNQIETFRVMGLLVEKYGLDRKHPAIEKAAEYLFSCQTEEGDFRGIYSCQYTPNYSAAIMELLISLNMEQTLE